MRKLSLSLLSFRTLWVPHLSDPTERHSWEGGHTQGLFRGSILGGAWGPPPLGKLLGA